MDNEWQAQWDTLGLMSRCTRPEPWIYFSPMDTCRSKSFNSSSENSSPCPSFCKIASARLPPAQTQWGFLNLTIQSSAPTIWKFTNQTNLSTITVFILNDHVIILCPCRIISNNMWVVAKYGMRVYFLKCQLPEKTLQQGGNLMQTEIKFKKNQFFVLGREITCCWLTRWQSPPGVVEIVLWRISNRQAASHICKLPQIHPRRCAPAPGTRSHSETAWMPGQHVSARQTDAGADTTRNS